MHLQLLDPNCFCKDPDINMYPFFFASGKILSGELGTPAWDTCLTTPAQILPNSASSLVASLLPLAFFSILLSSRKIGWTYLHDHILRQCLPHIGDVVGTKRLPGLFFMVRFLENNWFVWVTQRTTSPCTMIMTGMWTGAPAGSQQHEMSTCLPSVTNFVDILTSKLSTTFFQQCLDTVTAKWLPTPSCVPSWHSF